MADTNAGLTLSRSRKHRPKRDGKRRVLRVTLWILLLFSAVIIAYGIYVANKLDGALDSIAAPDPDQSVIDAVYGNQTVEKRKPDVEVTNILILGTDNRPRIGSLNTDVIMIASLRPDTKSAIIASMPRDTYMNPTGWREAKANSFYASARKYNKDTAYDTVREIFGEFFGVPIDYVVEIDFKAFEDIINAFGGITVDVDMDMRYVDPTDGTNINLKKGRQLLDGKQALDFVRYRMSNDGTRESSDFERNMRQQQVISAIVSKVKSLETIFRVGEVLDAAGTNIKTSIPRSDIDKLIRTYVGIKTDNIEFMRLEGRWKSPYVWPDQSSLEAIRQALKDHMTVDQ